MSNHEVARTVINEEAVLEKFEGNPEDGIILERITLVNGVKIKHEFFEDGELVEGFEGGN